MTLYNFWEDSLQELSHDVIFVHRLPPHQSLGDVIQSSFCTDCSVLMFLMTGVKLLMVSMVVSVGFWLRISLKWSFHFSNLLHCSVVMLLCLSWTAAVFVEDCRWIICWIKNLMPTSACWLILPKSIYKI